MGYEVNIMNPKNLFTISNITADGNSFAEFRSLKSVRQHIDEHTVYEVNICIELKLCTAVININDIPSCSRRFIDKIYTILYNIQRVVSLQIYFQLAFLCRSQNLMGIKLIQQFC